jgi:signal transduction histidine kinase
MNPIMFRPPSADDDDRRTNSFLPCCLDQPPSVDAGKHQIEDADIRALEAKTSKPGLALPDAERVEPGCRQVPSHPLCDHIVILDDQHLGHTLNSMRRLIGQTDSASGDNGEQLLDAVRGRMLVEESREIVIVLDESGRVVTASRRARDSLEGVEPGAPLPEELLRPGTRRVPFTVDYEVEGQQETLLYLTEPGELAAYEELRAGFTAAVSHELRTPLARIMALLETAELPGFDPQHLVEQARAEVEQIRELIDDVLFLSELETGREIVSLGYTPALPILREVVDSLAERAARAGIALDLEGDASVELPVRPRMLRVIAENLAQNALRYAGPGSTFTLRVDRHGEENVLEAQDDGIGVAEHEVPRLFERFYRADRARASRGTGLGLAIVKHVVTAADGVVEASGGRGEGLTIRCRFPASVGASPR